MTQMRLIVVGYTGGRVVIFSRVDVLGMPVNERYRSNFTCTVPDRKFFRVYFQNSMQHLTPS